MTALSPGDRPIRASFVYGTYCAMSPGCAISGLADRVDFGYAVFSYEDAERHEYVYVAADAEGKPRLAGQLSTSPPAFMAVPTPIP